MTHPPVSPPTSAVPRTRPAPAHTVAVSGPLIPPPQAPAAPPATLPVPVAADSFAPARPVLVPESEPVRVSVDNNRCHIYGICQQEAPEVFRVSEGGSLHYTPSVPAEFAARARQAARCCPMQAIAVRGGQRPGGGPADDKPRRPPLRSGAGSRTGRRRIVVAGGGLAGLSAATRLRERGFDGELVVVGEEDARPYSRPPLSKQYLAGELTDGELAFRADDALDAHWLLGTRVVDLDARAGALELRGGERLPFDGLVIATGVDAKRLPEAPLLSDRIRTIRTLADAAAVRRAMAHAKARHVVILGGGFVGCELACTARAQGMEVTLVVHSAPLLRRVLGTLVGGVVGRIQERAGVELKLGREVADWQDHGDVLRLQLDDGTTLTCDFVVLGLGGEPRTEWLRGSGLDIGDGVRCTPTCHVRDVWGRTVPHIVAAGDVASWPNARFDDKPRRVEHLIHAVEMGQHAADALLRGPDRAARFTPVPRFWSEQHGTRIQAVGIPALAEEVEVVEGSLRSERFIARYSRPTPYGPQVVGAVAFDMPLELLAYRDQIGRARPQPPAIGRRRRR
jgi:NADPH-dependent 2,4-dienoyl-CoA reductase/sulfur reductase-like enzyme/ferredoxin